MSIIRRGYKQKSSNQLVIGVTRGIAVLRRSISSLYPMCSELGNIYSFTLGGKTYGPCQVISNTIKAEFALKPETKEADPHSV